MTGYDLTPELLDLMAARFKALGERARLQILVAVRDGERTVTEIGAATGLGQANLSKHLQLLHSLGFLARRREGLRVYYGLSGEDVFRLCDVMCGRLAGEAAARSRLFRSD